MSQEFHKVHRLTPLLRVWTLILAIMAGVAFNVNASTWAALWGLVSGAHEVALWPLLGSIAVAVVVCALIWGLSQIWWNATGYRITEEELQMKRGVLNTQLRSARFDRIQAVDIVESIIARLFRVAIVRVETAGGENSSIEISYLTRLEAEKLKQALLDAAQHPSATPAAAGERQVEGGVEKQALVPEIPIMRSVLSAVLSVSTLLTVVGVGIMWLTPIGIAGGVPFLAGMLPSVWNLVDKSWKYQAQLGEGVLHVSYGLADRRRQAIPLERIHAISLSQPLLWRLLGWWTVSVTVVGYGADTKRGGTSKILPVGSKELALKVLEAVGPLNAEEISRSAQPEHLSTPNYTSPAAAKWISPVDRSRQGVTLIGPHAEVAVVHLGRMVPRMAVIETTHIQELTLKRGLIQRQLGLSTVEFNLVPGPVSMAAKDLEYDQGMELLQVLRQRKLPALQALPGLEEGLD
ncbi:PH domain-containing protein [Corynebacterium callunae]|uniref:PH domain-containing protein n=1 Tax=Corynebacterium callunae TaxID=1721 RepID=UPI0039828D51